MRVQIEKLIELQDVDKKISGMLTTDITTSTQTEGTVVFQKLSRMKKIRSAISKDLEIRILNRYERLRGNKGETKAVVPVINGVCQGCFISVSTATSAELQRCNSLLSCDHCGRFIYHLA